MGLKEELLELESKLRVQESDIKKNVILLHAKAHMFHNKKIHARAIELFKMYGIEHVPYDELDKTE